MDLPALVIRFWPRVLPRPSTVQVGSAHSQCVCVCARVLRSALFLDLDHVTLISEYRWPLFGVSLWIMVHHPFQNEADLVEQLSGVEGAPIPCGAEENLLNLGHVLRGLGGPKSYIREPKSLRPSKALHPPYFPQNPKAQANK